MKGWSTIVKTDFEIHGVKEYLRLAVQGGPQVVAIKAYRKKRSVAQNSLMWLWYGVISNHILDSTGGFYSSNDIHEWFKQLFLPKRIIDFKSRVLEIQTGTSELNVMEMMEYLNNLDHYCIEKLDLDLPKPEDLWLDAQGK